MVVQFRVPSKGTSVRLSHKCRPSGLEDQDDSQRLLAIQGVRTIPLKFLSHNQSEKAGLQRTVQHCCRSFQEQVGMHCCRDPPGTPEAYAGPAVLSAVAKD